ncbi:MAG: glycosyltransferase family 2 protein [Elusimicrobia bacterium]|nr:glycosyltransferase family 2 protein [Elusimicrobiota bacterium]
MKVLAAVFCFNEKVKIERTLARFPAERPYDLLVMDDGSDDGSIERIRRVPNVIVISNPRNQGIGNSIRTVGRYALEKGYDVVVHVAGNDKDDPLLIPRLLRPIAEEGYDFIQGSRYLEGGDFGNMPFYRVIATRFVHPVIASLVARRRFTDSTNGFRAYKTSLLTDPRIDLAQDWLGAYELEVYMLCTAARLGYRVKEVPVSKFYPPSELGYTKMKPFTGWWSILRPLVYLGLGLKK